MAELLRTNGVTIEVVPTAMDGFFTLEELYALLDTDVVEMLRMPTGQWLIIDEQGKFKRREPNLQATFRMKGRLMPGDVIVGPALVCDGHEMR